MKTTRLPQITRRASIAVCVAALAAVLSSAPPAGAAPGDGSPGDTNISYIGRWDKTSSTFYASNWAGAYLRTGFTGTTVRVRQRNSVEFWASVDGRAFVKFTGVSGTVNLTPTPLASGSHTLVVNYRQRAGSYNGDAVFGGLVLDAGATTFAIPVRPKVVEFIGDSITAGTLSTNLAITDYGWLTGERLGTEHTQIAIGGACLVAAPDGCWGMEQRYFKIDAASTANWDFSRYRADVVVINLGTNDVGHSVTGAQFQSSYTTFLRNIRAKYPAAAILALKTFRGRYITETQNAVTAVNNAATATCSLSTPTAGSPPTGWQTRCTPTTSDTSRSPTGWPPSSPATSARATATRPKRPPVTARSTPTTPASRAADSATAPTR